MADMLRDVAKRDWFRAASVQTVFSVLGEGNVPVRIVGGAVRDALAGLPIGDIDFATPLTPDHVVERLRASGLKAVPTGIEHGTVTAVVAGTGYQVTTLREDIETDGRRAVVRFGHDWVADAGRRDFTVNALSVDSSGKVHDPLGGYGDIVSRVVRFIGNADRRIAEDRLRVLRFFRFNAEFGQGRIDTVGLGAAIRARNDLGNLSAERVGQEMQRLVLAPRAAEIAGAMQDAGILGAVLGGVGYVGPLQRVAAFAPESDMAVRLTALGCRVESDVERLTERMRLSNAVRDRMLATLMAARRLPPVLTERDARRGLYRSGV
ncbi:MAG: CCA tRNA nucleotidyltransferase, partial [Hyphomicrobiales bacterium]|nr:CCA tRNA nucleotidyltransferase [Hyphomicrobiales bacterium]